MREIIAICRSGKKSRARTSRVLDRYFWRIGDRTWRGKATNACLDRVSRELRAKATKNTAVLIYEVRSSHASRRILISIGAWKKYFSQDGLVPISSHPSLVKNNSNNSEILRCSEAMVKLGALFHDLGKSTRLFQNKLKKNKIISDPIRHELHSVFVWDELFGHCNNEKLPNKLSELSPSEIDTAFEKVSPKIINLFNETKKSQSVVLGLKCLENNPNYELTQIIALLILTHHRLPGADSSHINITAEWHVNSKSKTLTEDDLLVARGIPFWHETWWITRVRRVAKKLGSLGKERKGKVTTLPKPNTTFIPQSVDISLRSILMFADHVGSSKKECTYTWPDQNNPVHLANTVKKFPLQNPKPGDSLSKHIERVYLYSKGAFDLLHFHQDRFPSLDAHQVPHHLGKSSPGTPIRFRWQNTASEETKQICSANEGGFFGCIIAGTGTGKTRGAPSILSQAALSDQRPERRYVRFFLGLGLRVLAKQSADAYVNELGFSPENLACLIGDPPLQKINDNETDDDINIESQLHLPEWMQIEPYSKPIPEDGSKEEKEWLKSLSMSSSSGLPYFTEIILESTGRRSNRGRILLQTPIIVGTIDHLMDIASPIRSKYLLPSLRLMTSDLILDEVDQYQGEDIAAVCRLVYQAGVMGRRVIIMSATLTEDISATYYQAYSKGWSAYSHLNGIRDHVNILCVGETPNSCVTNSNKESFREIYQNSRDAVIEEIKQRSAVAQRGKILSRCDTWENLVDQTDKYCSFGHERAAIEIDGLRVSVGLVRLTRIKHTAALAVQLPSGKLNNFLRLKVCLHSNFPRFHRAWIEDKLKSALTRHENNKFGIRNLCIEEKLFERAKNQNVHNIQIVVIASPVMETGNDLDFDYAILDPYSVRSVIQTAGRVSRHRKAKGCYPNVLIMAQSPIAMESKKLAYPGVETPLPKETFVGTPNLNKFVGRYFDELSGDIKWQSINSVPILKNNGCFPLQEVEAKLISKMLSVEENAPLGLYTRHNQVRMNRKISLSRKFRRNSTFDIVFRLEGEDFPKAIWKSDYGRGENHFEDASDFLQKTEIKSDQLFLDYSNRSWKQYQHSIRGNICDKLKQISEVRMAVFNNEKPKISYSDFTGFTMGSIEDLSNDFGKE